MILSRKWLNEFVDGVSVRDISDKEFSEAMTLSGSKVETVEDQSAQFKNVVVGKILSMEKHPNSDHMWVTQIDVGEAEPVQICTGAWNIHVGDLVPVAKHKSLLPGGVKITKGKLRGVPSCGMLCSLAELAVEVRDFPYAEIKAAAILGDYHVLPGEKPSIPEDVQPGLRIYGKVYTAQVLSCETVAYFTYKLVVDWGKGEQEISTNCANIHQGDMICVDTKSGEVLTLAGLHAQQKEFPNCIEDGIFILNEEGAKPGDDIPAVLGLDDHVVEYEITPNRPDCLGVIGLAREAAVTFGKELKLHEPEVKGCGDSILNYADVDILDGDLCPRYCGRLVRNVKIGPSPKWMRERLRASGVRPINNIVDITNYVMLEYGQPMHSFDFSCVEGQHLNVRRAYPDENMTTLDGKPHKLNETMLVIADDKKPVCIAGVMGGENSEITDGTTTVFFESANFNGVSVRKTAMALGMRTEASARYEKGLDPMNTLPAVQRACELVELLGCGEVIDGVIDVVAQDFVPTQVRLEPAKVNGLLGTDFSREEMVKILTDLGFILLDDDMLVVPSWRSDVEHYSDIAEEIARFTGYDNLPITLMRGETTRGGLTSKQAAEKLLGMTCRGLGFNEIMTYSFISPSYYNKIRLPEDSPLRNSIRILNPLGEDTSIMRTTALPSMLETLARNYSRHNLSAHLYELARIYLPDEGELANEQQFLSMGCYSPKMDFFQFKGCVESVFDSFGIQGVEYTACSTNPTWHPGRCAVLTLKGVEIGVMGQIHPLTAKNYNMQEVAVYAAQIDFGALLAARPTTILYQPLPKFPAVERDIAVVCDKEIPVSRLEDCIRRGGKGLVREIELFDIYTGKPIPEDKKSVAFALKLRHDDRTLTDVEADEDVKNVLTLLEQELNAVLR
jgi:phenylalanyl-tRNA synthetase beta chain